MRLACKSACLRVLACQTVAPRHAAHACGAADARLTDCAREGLRRAGRDAGTGALNRTQELTLRETAAAFVALPGRGKKRVTRRRRHLNADLDRRLHVARGVKRLVAAGILDKTRRLVRETIYRGGVPLKVVRQASNLYAMREPPEWAWLIPVTPFCQAPELRPPSLRCARQATRLGQVHGTGRNQPRS